LRYSLFKTTENAINNGEHPRDAVKLKQDTSLEDWLAVHVVDFMNRIDLLYGLVKDACTFESCPKMSGGLKYEYKWADDGDYKKPTALPARTYIELLFEWVDQQIHDENIFPTDCEVEFPKNFKEICMKILSRMYRVFVHVYIHHFDKIKEMDHLNAEAHLNTLFKHFYFFVTEFNLLSERDLEPLAELVKNICV